MGYLEITLIVLVAVLGLFLICFNNATTKI